MRLSFALLLTLSAGNALLVYPVFAETVGGAVVGTFVGGAITLGDKVLGEGREIDRRTEDLDKRADGIEKSLDDVEKSQNRTIDRLKKHEQEKEYKGY